jgi:hypothetical protein
MSRLKKWLRDWLEVPDGTGSGYGFTEDDRKKLDEAHRLHEAVDRAAGDRKPGEYRVAEIFATKSNPITEYRVNLDP